MLPYFLKQSLKTQEKLKELEICIKIESISVFLVIAKFVDLRWNNADVSRTQGVGHMTHIFFGSSLGKV